jgi:hypothetical protein
VVRLGSNWKKGNEFCCWGRAGEMRLNLCRNLEVGYTELSCSKLKKGKGFLKPNFERGPNPWARLAPGRQVRRVFTCKK